MNGYRKGYDNYSYLKKRSRTTFFTSLLSIGLVLFFLGIFATLALFSQTLAESARSSIVMKVFLYDGISTTKLHDIMDKLSSEPYILDYRYISKEEAWQKYLERTGEDLVEVLDGINPLLACVDIRLQDPYIQSDSLAKVREALESEVLISEVYYPEELLAALSRNLKPLSMAAGFIGLIVVFIAFFLIFGTIRLSIYAKRLIIRSMQLIGATKTFIRRPFLIRGMGQGFLAGIVACIMLGGLIWVLSKSLTVFDLQEKLLFTSSFIGILGGIVLFGSVLGLMGSLFAVNRYLGKDMDELMR